MSLNNPVMHEGFVPAYQVSAAPFVTSSNVTLGQTKEIRFNYVTRFFTIKNTSTTSTNTIAVAFTQNGLTAANSNFFPLSGSEAYSGELRVDRLFVSGSVGTSSFTIVAGLTNIPSRNFLTVTGSNGFNGVG